MEVQVELTRSDICATRLRRGFRFGASKGGTEVVSFVMLLIFEVDWFHKQTNEESKEEGGTLIDSCDDQKRSFRRGETLTF